MIGPLAALRTDPSGFSAAETRIAQMITANPQIVVERTITDLAALCETSPATIARFAQTLGFSGYRQFRLEMVQELSREEAGRERFGLDHDDILLEDSAERVASKIAFQEMRAIEQTAHAVRASQIDAAAVAISTASRVDLLGVGASTLAATDLHQKLQRIGHPAWHSSDVHLALVQAAQRSAGDVVVGFSHSGTTREVTGPMALAHSGGALTIAVTNVHESPITHHADIVLLTHARESPFRIGATSSRIAQLTLVDILFTRIVQKGGDKTRDVLRRTRNALGEHSRA